MPSPAQYAANRLNAENSQMPASSGRQTSRKSRFNLAEYEKMAA